MLLVRLLTFILFISLSTLGRSSDPIEVPTKKDDLEEIQLKSQLEDSLARDIQAYLGHSRFIVNVDVSLQKIRQIVKQKQASSGNNRSYPQVMSYPKLRFPKQDVDEVEGGIERLPGLPFVDIPVDKEKDAELQFMREQIQRLQRQQRQPQWENDNERGQAQNSEETTVGVFNKINKLYISLLVEDTISAEQELFLRNLVYQKAGLNDLRGDEFKLIKTQFSRLPDQSTSVEETRPIGWLQENFDALLLGLLSLLALLLIALLIASLRKKEPSTNQSTGPVDGASLAISNPALGAAEATLSEQVDKKQLMLKTRQDIISLGLGQPQHVQGAMDQLIAQEDKIPMIASIYKILGRSLFRSIFPNIEQVQLQSIMAQLADQPPEEEQQAQDIQDFYQILQQKIHNLGPSHAHPFEFLNKLNDSQVLYLVQHEDARIQALVISQLEPEQGARVLNRIPEKRQALVMAELGQFETFPMDTFKDVADRLAKAAQQVPSFENVNADGLGMLMSMLDNMSTGEEAKVLKRLKQDKPDTFYRLRQMYFTFPDIARTPKPILSNALREVDRSFIGRALCNTPDEFKIHVLTALTPKLKALVREDLKRLEGRIDNREIDKSRKSIVHKLREYINTGKFSMDQLQTAQRANG